MTFANYDCDYGYDLYNDIYDNPVEDFDEDDGMGDDVDNSYLFDVDIPF